MKTQEAIIYVCHNSRPADVSPAALEEQARQAAGGLRVAVRETPCSGKMDVNYILRAFEGGARGVGLVTCPLAQCRLAEGNRRAQVRTRHLRALLDEIGLGGDRVVLLHRSMGPVNDLARQVVDAARRIAALEANPLAEPAEAVGVATEAAWAEEAEQVEAK
jgi:F420-non-reducing hydrogenase iron-sulfur subunit